MDIKALKIITSWYLKDGGITLRLTHEPSGLLVEEIERYPDVSVKQRLEWLTAELASKVDALKD